VGAPALVIVGTVAGASPVGASLRPDRVHPQTSVSCTTTAAVSYGAAPVRGTIASAGDTACFTFTTAEGDAVWADLAATSGSLSLFEDIYRPGPISTCAGPYGGPGACDVPTGGAGTWTLQVSDSFGTHTGTFNVSIQRLDVGVGCKAIKFGKSAVKGKVAAAASSTCYTFSGDPSEYLFVRAVGVSGTLGAPTVLLASPDGSEPCGFAEGGTLECPLTESGTQTLLVYSSLETPTGSFRIYDQQLTAPEHCTAASIGGGGKKGKVKKAGDVACFSFPGTAGGMVNIALTGLSGSLSPLIDVFRPSGTSACATPGTSIGCSLDTTGKWTTLVWDDSATGGRTGSFTATFTG
jgi:hypothetical protein